MYMGFNLDSYIYKYTKHIVSATCVNRICKITIRKKYPDINHHHYDLCSEMLHVPNTNPAHRQHPHRRRQHATNYDLSVTAFLPSAIWEGSSEFKLLIRTSVVGAFSSVFAQPDLSINFQPAFDASVIQQPNKTDTAAHKQVTPVCVAGSRSVVGT